VGEATSVLRVAALRRVAWVTALVPALYVTPAFGENPDTYYLSSDAAMQAGAITADVTGGGAIWYNPAGLARLPGLRLDVSMNAYSLRFGGHPDLGGATDDAQVTRLSTVDFKVVPAGLTLTHRFGSWGVGFGVFVPSQNTTLLRTQVAQRAQSGDAGITIGVDSYETVQQYQAGPAIGWSLAPGVDFGVSALFHYRTELSTGALDVDITGDEGDSFRFTQHTTTDVQQIGFQPVVGLQLRPTKTWRIGATFRFPSARLFEIRQAVNVGSLDGGDLPDGAGFSDDLGISTALVSPARFHAGLSHDLGALTLAAEVNYQAPFRSDEANVDLRPLLNLRFGGRYAWTPNLVFGGGVFSNRADNRGAQSFGDSKLDFYGVTAAVDLGTPYRITARDGKPMPEGSELVFGTTVALTYAVGIGSIVGAEVGLTPEGTPFFEEIPSNVTAHEVLLHIGATLAE